MTAKFSVGSKDPYIKNIQQALNEKLGANGPQGLPTKKYLVPDGQLGPMSCDCLKAYQTSIGLQATGQYDTPTAANLDPYIELRFLTESDYVGAASLLNEEVAAIKAVTDVESKEWGFLPNGKPEILYERHQFRKQLIVLMKQSTIVATDIAQKVGVLIPATGPDISLIDQTMIRVNPDIYNDQPGGYSANGMDEYKRLAKAQTFHSSTALKSASWGLFQIMGYYFSQLGYTKVEDMVADAYKSEDLQLQHFCKYMQNVAPNLITAMRDKNWAAFAKGYNGPNYAINRYDVKLAAAYNTHK